MNTESAYFLHVLRCFVNNEAPKSFEGDWNELARLAGIHSVMGILGYMMMSHPECSAPSMQPMFRSVCMNTIGRQAQRGEAMRQLIRQMNENEIDHLLFKGFVLKDYYPVPELRTFGDIDFLIRREDREKSDAIMMENQFVRETDWEPVYTYVRQAECYEIHTDVMEVDVSDKADYKGYFQHVWEYAVCTGEHTFELKPEVHFLYLLTHIAKHISSSGAGIRMYLDIAIFLQRFGDSLDWDFVAEELKKLAFSDFANMVLTLVETYFGVDSPLPLCAVEPQVLDDFMEFTLAGGVFGHVGRESGAIYLKNESRNDEEISRGATLLHRVFPSAEQLEKRYTYLQNNHWLLPAAWVHRLIKTRDKMGYHAQQAKEIMNADTEEVLKLRRIYKAIGL